MKTRLLTLIFITFIQVIFSQNSPVNFQGETIQMNANIDSFTISDLSEDIIVNNGFYGWVQFAQTPNQNIQDNFKNRNLKLISFIENKTYLFYFPLDVDLLFLKTAGVRSIKLLENRFKMSSDVKYNNFGDWSLEGNNVVLNIQHFKNLNTDLVVSKILSIPGLEIKNQYKNNNNLTISIPKESVTNLVSFPFIKWVEVVQEPDVKEDDRGRSIHRASNLDTQTPSGRNYTGLGIGVLVRDDGIVGPHIDFQGRIDNSAASGTSTADDHGDGVAGIMAGAGNLDPSQRGMAAESTVYVVNYAGSFLDASTTNLINNGDVQITNSSYGNGCNAGYTSTSNTVDTQSNDNLSLLHVFSAGNSGGSDCGYVPGSNWGNITGGHKQGKNVIATANVFFNGNHVSSSSHGPAYDGRIKPDITAHGQGQGSTDDGNVYQSFGGTSGAAPGIAGVSAQLYQLYKDANGGTLPESALIKATLLNTAQDYGRVGPDFEYGWGLVNGLRAAMLLEDGRHLNDEIAQDETNNHTINVPTGTTQVRFMVYWNDPAAASGASKALINDLDLKVTDPSNTELNPWILNSSPNAATLDDPATTGVDRLNNMEQVLINNPAAGNYNININGFNVPQGPQKYFVVYEIISDELVLTYPQGGEKLETGNSAVIHWDSTNLPTSNNIEVEYSSDNGGSWNAIASISSSSRNYNWNIPSDLASGEYLVRVSSGSFNSQSETFTIAGSVSGINATQVCPTELSLGWNSVADATEYKIYLLGDKFMEEVGTTTATSFAVTIPDPNPEDGFWLAVSASGSNWETRRSVAINQTGGLFNCSLANDISVTSIEDISESIICTGNDTFNIQATISNTGSDSQTGFIISYQLDSGTIINETYSATLNNGAQDTYTFATPLQITTNGSHNLRVFITNTGDQNATNDEQTLSFYTQVTGAELNVVEGLDVFPPEGWRIENPDNDNFTWEEATKIGSDGNNTTVSFLDHGSYSNRGRLDYLITDVYDLSNAATPELKFDVAKAQWSATYNDALIVEVSTDCGVTYNEVYNKDGLTLSTIDNYTGSEWSPASAADWRNEVVDLSAYIGEKVTIRFVAVNDYSNSTYIDNIEVSGVLSIDKETLDNELSIYPNPTKDNVFIKLKNSQQINNIKVYNMLGKEINVSKITRKNNSGLELNMNSFSSGMYIIRVEADSGYGFRKIIKE